MAKREDRFNKREDSNEPKLIEKLVCINRVTKVVKGGRNMRFAALMVVGDGAGKVGVGMGKSAEVPEAISKAKQAAVKNMSAISVVGTSIPHTVTGVFGRGQVLMMPAGEGTGVIAGGSVRAVLEAVGIKDIRTKSIGSSTPANCVKATIDGLKQLRTVEEIAAARGKKPEEIR
jgi:small subunit ribosomal protein S5